MRTSLTLLATAAILGAFVLRAWSSPPESDSPKKLFLDVHQLGPGNVTDDAVAEAHRKDLEIQDQLDVEFERYWVDEEQGAVYCLAHAHSADDVAETHRRAHGLVPDRVHPVVAGEAAPAEGGRGLYLDIHELGSVDAAAVAEAHEKDLAVQDHYGVSFLEYWVDEEAGTVACLSEAPRAEAVNAAHGAAHGLLADRVHEVTEGR